MNVKAITQDQREPAALTARFSNPPKNQQFRGQDEKLVRSCPSGQWRRIPSVRETDQRPTGSVMKRTWQISRSRRYWTLASQYEPAGRSCPFRAVMVRAAKGTRSLPSPSQGEIQRGAHRGCPAKDRVRYRESGRRRPASPRGRGYSARPRETGRWGRLSPTKSRRPGPWSGNTGSVWKLGKVPVQHLQNAAMPTSAIPPPRFTRGTQGSEATSQGVHDAPIGAHISTQQ